MQLVQIGIMQSQGDEQDGTADAGEVPTWRDERLSHVALLARSDNINVIGGLTSAQSRRGLSSCYDIIPLPRNVDWLPASA